MTPTALGAKLMYQEITPCPLAKRAPWLFYRPCCSPALLGSVGLADDAPMAGIGGTYSPMRGESSVRLVREFIRVDYSPKLARTTVQFEFRNEGSTHTVVVGFPEKTINTDEGSFLRFRRELDGHRLRARPTPWKARDDDYTGNQRWWISRVPFRAGQRRVVRVSYEQHPGKTETCSCYDYILGTGHAWKGAIDEIQFVMTLDLPYGATIVQAPPGTVRRDNRLSLASRNCKPDSQAVIEVWSSPFIDSIWFGADFDETDVFKEPCFHQGYLEWDLYQLANTLKATRGWDERTRTGYLRYHGKTLALTAGSKQALLIPARKPVLLPFAPYLDGDSLRVPLRAVCEALGSSVTMKRKGLGNWVASVERRY